MQVARELSISLERKGMAEADLQSAAAADGKLRQEVEDLEAQELAARRASQEPAARASGARARQAAEPSGSASDTVGSRDRRQASVQGCRG